MADLALSYVARYATSAARLESYLVRKVKERGFSPQNAGGKKAEASRTQAAQWPVDEAGSQLLAQEEIALVVERLTGLGYVDDALFAQGKARDLLARGYGARRIEQALRQAGIEETSRKEARPAEAARRHAALVYARKRRFGPFGPQPLDPARREKQIAAMLRAGHDYAAARAMIDASGEEEALEWVEEAGDQWE